MKRSTATRIVVTAAFAALVLLKWTSSDSTYSTWQVALVWVDLCMALVVAVMPRKMVVGAIVVWTTAAVSWHVFSGEACGCLGPVDQALSATAANRLAIVTACLLGGLGVWGLAEGRNSNTVHVGNKPIEPGSSIVNQ
jgi:hypothetical protein